MFIYIRICVLTARLTGPVSDDGERGRKAGRQCGCQRVDCSGGVQHRGVRVDEEGEDSEEGDEGGHQALENL